MATRTRLILIAAVALAGAAAHWRWPADDFGPPPSAAFAALPLADKVARGAYLARAGDCMACHTARGGAEYAGGRALPTPFGAVVAPNITPDRRSGIGDWSADDFWQALHNGKSKDGRLLYPAFPYTDFTKISRDDADAMYAFFQTVPPSPQANRPHEVRFPYDRQVLLSLWRALYFRPGVYQAQSARSAQWNRGAYLVRGAGHCAACHSARNPLGATDHKLSGGLIPIQGWYAPSLTSGSEAGLGDWDIPQIVSLLKTGVSQRATVFGPMAEVVRGSLQHLTDDDVTAMAVYLKSLPGPTADAAPDDAAPSPQVQARLAAGAKLYRAYCVDCHGENGRGSPPAYPPLAGNRALTTLEPANPIRIVLNGGFAPGTAGNPRPYGMPAFGPILNDTEVAAVVSYLRASWGNKAPPVTQNDVNRYRSVPLN